MPDLPNFLAHAREREAREAHHMERRTLLATETGMLRGYIQAAIDRIEAGQPQVALGHLREALLRDPKDFLR